MSQVIAETRNAIRVLETSHPPAYYIPPEDVKMDRLSRSVAATYCEWKVCVVLWIILNRFYVFFTCWNL